MSTPLVSDTPLAPADARPDVLAMPSPTVSRFVLLLAALLSSGLFVGTWVHNQTSVGTDWLDRVMACEGVRPEVDPGAGAAEILRAEQVVLACVEGAQQRLAWFAVGGAVLTLLAACVVLAAVPRTIVRRRALRPAGPKLTAASERVAALAGEEGLRRSPEVLVGSSRLRDAFSLGLPGRYSVALPPALAVRSGGPEFDPLVRHELAHVARQDVLLAWAARALWYVVVPLLALPLVVSMATADGSLLPSYWWRAALLLAATILASAGILRSREHDADLGSARTSARRDALSSLLLTSGRRPAIGWRRLVRLHPDASERVETLRNPALLAAPSAVDAAIAGFLAALTIPLLVGVLATVPSWTVWAYAVPAVLVGPVMGASVGLALWRLALIGTVTATVTMPRAARRVAAGVFMGFLVGQAASLATVGTGTMIGARTPLPAIIGAVALAGTTFVVAGLGMLAADRAGRLSARGFAASAVATSGTLFALMLWAATTLTRALDLGGWSFAVRVALELLTQPGATAVVLALALSVGAILALPAGGGPPGWAFEGDAPESATRRAGTVRARPPLVVGPVAGLAAALSILVFRLTAGPATTFEQQAQRFDVYIWVFAGAGMAAGLSLLVLCGLRGAGLGLLAAPIASAVAALGFVLVNTAFGGIPTLEFIAAVGLPGLSLGVLLLLVGASTAAFLSPPSAARPPLPLLVLVAAILASAVTFGAISARDMVSPPPPPILSEGMSVPDYIGSYAPSVASRLFEIDQAGAVIDADARLSPPERAQRIRAELATPVADLLGEAEALVLVDDGIVRTHAVLVSGLEGTGRAFENFARAYETGDSVLFLQTRTDRAAAQQLLLDWMDDVDSRSQ
jgi:hypothetical protein